MHKGGSKLLLTLLLAVLGIGPSRGQSLIRSPWQPGFSPVKTYTLDPAILQELLQQTTSRWQSRADDPPIYVSLPQPDGSELTYQLWSSEQMEPALAARFPHIRTYFGQAVNNSRLNIYLLRTGDAIKVLYFDQAGIQYRLEPTNTHLQQYRFSMRAEWGNNRDLARVCGAIADEEDLRFQETYNGKERRGETRFYRYRLALACTGEYGSYHGGTVESVLGAMNELLLQVNAIYEREISVHFDLVANNHLLIFVDPATDPYDNSSMEDMLETNKTICNYAIGYPNFDLGQVLSTKFGGQAHIGSVCNFSRKAKAFSGLETPEGYYMGTILAHELGHQIGAQHTQSNECNRNISTALEPGSGSTIMAYAGICAPNVQELPDDYFHGTSLELIGKKTSQGIIFGCVPGEQTDNLPPEADAGPDLYLPIGTPFRLEGKGFDPDGDSLSYLWEQVDVLDTTDTIHYSGPLFRSRPPSASPTRVIGDQQDIWEQLPNDQRKVTFRLTVRDHHKGLGSIAADEITVHFIDSAGPFLVQNPNQLGTRWKVGSTQTVSWKVGGTDAAPLLCDTVSILLSADGGQSFPVVLAEKVPNNGSASIKVPNTTGKKFRVKVMPLQGSFFDISDHNFEIFKKNPPPPPDTVATDTTNTGPVDTVPVMIDSTLNTGMDTLVIPEPDTMEVPVIDSVMVPQPDTIQVPVNDTITTPEPDTTEVPLPDTTILPPVDTTLIPPVDSLDNDPPLDTMVTMPVDTITPPPADTVVTAPVDTVPSPPMDTMPTPPQDTISIPPQEEPVLEPPMDTIPQPPVDSINMPEDPLLGDPVDTIPEPGAIPATPLILKGGSMQCKSCYPNTQVAPNPNRGFFYLRFALEKPEHGYFYLLNPQGKVVRERNMQLDAGAQELEWDISELPSGMYWLHIRIAGRQWAKAVVLEQ